MPAIPFLDELKVAQRDFRSMFLAVAPYNLRFTSYDQEFALCSMWLWPEEKTLEQLGGEGEQN
jgi:hypothetical protein